MCCHYVFRSAKSNTSCRGVPIARSDLNGAFVLVDLDFLSALQTLQVKLILCQRGPVTCSHPGRSIVSDNRGVLTHIHLDIRAFLGAETILNLPDVGVPTVRCRHITKLILGFVLK